MPYDWRYSPPVWYPRQLFPSEMYIGRDDSGWFDIFAGQTTSGIILWWKYQRSRPKPVPYPINLPEIVKWSQRNKRPNFQPAPGLKPQPSPAYSTSPQIDPKMVIVPILIIAGVKAVEFAICPPLTLVPVP